MKVNDKKELHGKEPAELKKMLRDGRELLLSLQLDRQQNKLKNTRAVYFTRKNIAIIKTILKGKEAQAAQTAAASSAVATAAEAKPAEKAETKKEAPVAKK